MGATLADAEDDYISLGPAVFRTRYGFPTLVQELTGTEDEEMGFRTGFMSPNELSTAATGELDVMPLGLAGALYPIVKPSGKPFQERIGVGRAPNADISIRLPRISKYHGYFTESEDGRQLFFTDADSKNGTRIGDRPVKAREPRLVPDGSTIAFGPYVFVLYMPRSFEELIAQRARAR